MGEKNLNQDRIKRMDLLGGLGAGILGGGLALLFARWLESFALPALLLGIATHGWAMYQKGRLERDAGLSEPRWAAVAEGVCWFLLALLFLYIGYRIAVPES